MQNSIEDKPAPGEAVVDGVPIDGRDIEGEELMKSVRNDKLENPLPLTPEQES